MWKKQCGPLYPFVLSSAFLLLLLTVARGVHTGLFYEHISSNTQLWDIFINGIRIDLVLTTYLFVIPILIYTALHTFLRITRPLLTSVFVYWTIIAFLVVLFMELVTPLYILEYGTRPERKFFEYLNHPKEVITMLSGAYGYTAIIIFTVMAVLTPFLIHMIKKVFSDVQPWTGRKYLLLMPLIVLVLIATARSSLDHRPINPSMVAFSDDVLLNNLPLNSLYSVLNAVYRLKDEEDSSEVYGRLSEDEINHFVYDNHPTRSVMRTNQLAAKLKLGNKKNLVIILEESLGSRFVERLNGSPLTPNLNKLSYEGWWFEHLYATGTRSVRGIEAVTTGFLPTPGRSVVKLGNAQSNFFTLASLLKNFGYISRFYYGGNAHFDNMKGFMLGNGFNKVVEQNDYINPRYIGSWGASDEDVFARIHEDLSNKTTGPQLLVTLTTSNHSPFDFPTNADGMYTTPTKSRENAIRYADSALGAFIDKAKQAEYWENTLFLIVADHDQRVADFLTVVDPRDKYKTTKIFPVDGFRIPGLILGGSIEPKVTKSIVSQIDLPPTLLSLMDIESNNPMIGVDLTHVGDDYKGRAIMQFSDQQAYLDDHDLVVLRPSLEPLLGHYDKGVFTRAKVRENLEAKALAHALWASKSYKENTYN